MTPISVFWIGNRGCSLGATMTQDEQEINMCIQMTMLDLSVRQIVIPYNDARMIVDKLNAMLTSNWVNAKALEGANDAVDVEGGIARF